MPSSENDVSRLDDSGGCGRRWIGEWVRNDRHEEIEKSPSEFTHILVVGGRGDGGCDARQRQSDSEQHMDLHRPKNDLSSGFFLLLISGIYDGDDHTLNFRQARAAKMEFHNMDVCGVPSCMERGGEAGGRPMCSWSFGSVDLVGLASSPLACLDASREPGVCAQTCERCWPPRYPTESKETETRVSTAAGLMASLS